MKRIVHPFYIYPPGGGKRRGPYQTLASARKSCLSAVGYRWQEATQLRGYVICIDDKTANAGLHRTSEAKHNQKGPTP